MAPSSFDHAAEARQALQAIVSDPRHGIDALSRPQLLTNLLTDLLPDAPRETGVLIAAARAGLADMLREHVAQGMDARTAAQLAVAAFANTTAFTVGTCAWVTMELAFALGLEDVDFAAAVPSGALSAATESAEPRDQQPTMTRPNAALPDAGSQPGPDQPEPAVAGGHVPGGVIAEGDVPAMPIVQPHELWFEPRAVTQGQRYSIGWQRWMPVNGGPQFVTLRRTALGTYKAIDRFPLTAEGWSAAWRALTTLEPATAEQARKVLARRPVAAQQPPGNVSPPSGTPARQARPALNQQQSPAAPVDELTRLAKLLDSGLLTREEFDRLKARLIS